jgi:hypothetical protein
MSHEDNIRRIKKVSEALRKVDQDIVFVGGATVSLYADRPTFTVRPTYDIDAIVEVLTYPEHAKFEELIRQHGFQNDTTSKSKMPL